MEWLILLTIMAVLFLIGMPLFYVVGLTAFFLLMFGDFPLINIPVRMFSGINSFILLAVPMFILAGEVMNQAGISRRLMDHASSLVGFMRGGLAHVNIVTSMFFAEMSGSGSAVDFQRVQFALATHVDVDAQGRIGMPSRMMERAGLGKDVVLIGVRDHIEIWDSTVWREYLAEQLERHQELLESGRQIGRGQEVPEEDQAENKKRTRRRG